MYIHVINDLILEICCYHFYSIVTPFYLRVLFTIAAVDIAVRHVRNLYCFWLRFPFVMINEIMIKRYTFINLIEK